MKKDSNREVFFALVRAGLWEQSIRLLLFGEVDFEEVMRLAEEQSVQGLVAAGMEYVSDTKIPKQDLVQFIGQSLQIEERNKALNSFIGVIVEKMRESGICALLVKGQGIAQCYERPLWRVSGDVDLLLSEDHYLKAKDFLSTLATSVDEEDTFRNHLGMTIETWLVELHGSMFTELSWRVNKCIKEVQNEMFYGGGVRLWMNEDVQVFLPNADNDAIIIFTHIIQHFYVGGIGLRQICDWCRLLWTYKDKIDHQKLEGRLKAMGLMTEWQAFAYFAVGHLGMPEDAMPFFKASDSFKRKAARISSLIIKTGTFGHNLDGSYRTKYSYWVQKTMTFFLRFYEFLRLAMIFPCNAPKFFLFYVNKRVKATF